MSGLFPHISIRDGRAAEALAFYAAAFDAKENMRASSEDHPGLILHASLTINGGHLMLNDVFPNWDEDARTAAPAAFTLHLATDDADAWFERAIAAGAEVVFPLEDQFWGERYGQLKDPFGVYWSIGGPIRK